MGFGSVKVTYLLDFDHPVSSFPFSHRLTLRSAQVCLAILTGSKTNCFLLSELTVRNMLQIWMSLLQEVELNHFLLQEKKTCCRKSN